MELMTRQKKLHLQIEQNLKRWEEVCALIEASK
jgi:hypothetical protein